MPCGAPWSAPDSPQAEVGDSCSALGTRRGPGCVPTVCSTTWEGLEPGASPGLIWAILERKVAGTLGTALCCWEKAEGRGVVGSAPRSAIAQALAAKPPRGDGEGGCAVPCHHLQGQPQPQGPRKGALQAGCLSPLPWFFYRRRNSSNSCHPQPPSHVPPPSLHICPAHSKV